MTGLRRTLRTPEALAEAGLLDPPTAASLAPVADKYAVAVTPAIASLIDRGDPADPIARQFIPSLRELEVDPAERHDPIGDHPYTPVKGVVHRHADRVLLKIVGVCPVYCRFCFRREMVGPDSAANLTLAEVEAALAYIASHPEIWEVILTGGDPLMLSPRRAREIGAELAQIRHVKVLRWHTRVPIAAPERLTDEMADAIAVPDAAIFVAVHANHPRELTPDARRAIRRLVDRGISVLSQTVLLKGLNDDADTMEALLRGLVETRVKPYYLHHCDLAPGTAHFRTSLEAGQELMRELRRRLSGVALPTYVLDLPGGYGKVPIGPTHIVARGDATEIGDVAGRRHAYPDAPRAEGSGGQGSR